MKKLFIISTICFFISISGFGQTNQDENQLQSVENTTDSISNQRVATIYFKRQGSMVGAVIKHFLIDRGDSLNMNGVIFQKKKFPLQSFNFCSKGNTKRLYYLLNNAEAAVLVSKPPIEGLKMLNVSQLNTSKLQQSIAKYSKSFPVGIMNAESMVPNANLIALVGSGETVVWNRPSGIMQLQVIIPNGDQFFAQSIQVESGKTYMVEYNYVKAKFEISEKK